jgi:hypothetical protein
MRISGRGYRPVVTLAIAAKISTNFATVVISEKAGSPRMHGAGFGRSPDPQKEAAAF